MSPQRQLHRIDVRRNGIVSEGDRSADCQVIDLTEQGVQLRTTLAVEIGHRLRLEFAVTDGVTVECNLLVTRVSGSSVGASIVDIAPDDRAKLGRFIEELIALNLGGI